MTDEGIDAATEVYQAWESREKLSEVITLQDARKTDYNLSPSQFVDVGDKVEHRPISEILADLTEARIAREKADKTLEDVLTRLGTQRRGAVMREMNLPEHWEVVRLGERYSVLKMVLIMGNLHLRRLIMR